jgi:hypothetical protein
MSTLKGMPFKQQKNTTRRTIPVPLEALVYVIRMSCCKSTTEIVSVPQCVDGMEGGRTIRSQYRLSNRHIFLHPSPPILLEMNE